MKKENKAEKGVKSPIMFEVAVLTEWSVRTSLKRCQSSRDLSEVSKGAYSNVWSGEVNLQTGNWKCEGPEVGGHLAFSGKPLSRVISPLCALAMGMIFWTN